MIDATLRNPDRYAHSTRARYNAGCRCSDCRAANAAYEQLRLMQPPNPLVSSARAREHLKALSARGVGRKTVAAVSGVGDSILWGIITGLRPNCRLSTERRILAVTEESIADGALVSAAETRRLLRELVTEGFRKTKIARALGSTARVPALQFKSDKVRASTERRVKEIHAELMGLDALVDTVDVVLESEGPKERILRAIRFFDWVCAEDLFDALDVSDEDRVRYTKALGRLAAEGTVRRRGAAHPFEYSLIATTQPTNETRGR